MPSSYTTRLRLTKQAAGENNNTWGVLLNTGVFDLIDFAIGGLTSVAMTANTTLTSANGTTDEARAAALKFTTASTGAYSLTIPSAEKAYLVWNASAYTQTITTGAGNTAAIGSLEVTVVYCDGTNVRQLGVDGSSMKAYVDAQAFAALNGSFPAQTGNAGKALVTDGTTASWGAIAMAYITGLSDALALKAPLASPAFTGDPTFAAGYTLTGASKGNVQALSGTEIDVSAAEAFTKSISSNTTFTITGATSGKLMGFILDLTISSSAVPTFPASVLWSAGVDPNPGTGRHLFGFITTNGGTNWIGMQGPTAVS